VSDNGQASAKLRKIDPGKLKLRELGEVEKLIGRRIAGELQSGDLGMDAMQALLWVELRKHDPAATFEQAGEYDLATLMDLFADADDEAEGEPVDPTNPPASAGNGLSSSAEPTSKPMLPSTTSGG
jgi:hypothetical protein